MNATVIRNLLLSGMLLVTAAGLYAALYTLGRMLESYRLRNCSYVFALLVILGAVGMVRPNFLDPVWKVLILFSAAVYLFAPQGMWRIVTAFHKQESWRSTISRTRR